MGSSDVYDELDAWLEKLRAMEPASIRVGGLAELDEVLDRLPYGEAPRWLDEHSDDINRVLIPMTRPVDDTDDGSQS